MASRPAPAAGGLVPLRSKKKAPHLSVGDRRHSASSQSADSIASCSRPTIPLGKKFWQLSDDEKWLISTLLDSSDVKTLPFVLGKRFERAKIDLIDAAYWMKGCSSLGRLRSAALIHRSGELKDKLSLVDIKEASPAAAPAAAGAEVPADHTRRVVAGRGRWRRTWATAWRPARSATGPSSSGS